MNAIEEEIRTVSIPEAARLLGIHEITAYTWARSGRLPGVVRLGRRVRVRLSELRRWMDAQQQRQQAGEGR